MMFRQLPFQVTVPCPTTVVESQKENYNRHDEFGHSRLAIGHDQGLGGAGVGWAYLVSFIDCCRR
jgi:hypothetical protein